MRGAPIVIHIMLAGGAFAPPDERRTYLIADRAVDTDGPISCLAPFADRRAAEESGPEPDPGPMQGAVLYRAVAPLGSTPCRVTCIAGRRAFWLDVETVGRFAVTRDGRFVLRQQGPAPARSPSTQAALLGPCMSLALAIADTWCLHASAIGNGTVLAAFVGESGRGKSMLAAAAHDTQGWRRAADDVLPVSMADGGTRVEGLPRYPQLKLPTGEQPGAALPDRVPLRAIYILERDAGAQSVSAIPLHGARAAAALVRHSVGTRLFDSALLQHHLTFCSQAGGAVAVRRIVYPTGIDRLPQVVDAVVRDIDDVRA